MFGGEWVTGLAQLLFTVSEVALLLEKTVLMRLPMPAHLCLVLLVELFHFLCIWCLVSLIHDHLVRHQVLLHVLHVAWIQAHHLLVVEHLIRHLPLVLLHLLHTHAHVVHLSRHAGHLISRLLHLSCSVHIHNINY